MISPYSVQSQTCKEELEHASKNGKRIIAIRILETDISTFPATLSPHYQWIECRRGQDDINIAIDKVLDALYKDHDWLKYHTELQNQAIKWENNNKDDSYLLRKSELQEAEQELASAGSSKDPAPTDLQREFIRESCRTEDEEKRRLAEERKRTRTRLRNLAIALGAIAIVATIAIVLATMFGGQVGTSSVIAQNADTTAKAEANARATAQVEAEQQTKASRAGQLVAE